MKILYTPVDKMNITALVSPPKQMKTGCCILRGYHQSDRYSYCRAKHFRVTICCHLNLKFRIKIFFFHFYSDILGGSK